MVTMASGDLSLTSNSSQEEESCDFVDYERTLRPLSNSSSGISSANMNSNVNSNNNNNNGSSNTTHSGAGNGNANNIGVVSSGGGSNNPKKYDAIKVQYDSALLELKTLRHQHADTVCRCDQLESQLAFYQEQYNAAMNQLKSSERSKLGEIMPENARLKQQNNMLERKFMRIEAENGNVQSDKRNANSYYCDYVDRSGGSVVSGSGGSGGSNGGNKCDGTCVESEKLNEELILSKERNNDLNKERNLLVAEREKYKENYNAALVDLAQERKFYRDSREQFNMQREQFQLQREIMEKENQKLKSLLAAESNKLLMITMQKGRIEEELNQLLSEKDNVLQEHQKMSDDLAAANKDLEQYKKDVIVYKNELKSLQQSNAELKKRDLLKSRESTWSKEFSDSKDDFKEIEKLRKSLEKAHTELERAAQDNEEAKRVRDWAISQREKIVQERDSVKTLCDNLRKERDKAISDLLSAIRDSEKIKKQKDEAQRKIDILKEQLEQNQSIDSSSRRSFRMSTYEAEDMLDIELSNYHADCDIGIILDDSNQRQLVCGVTNVSPAFGKLKINDVICKINNIDCQTLTKRMLIEEIRASAPRCNLLVSRTRHSKRHFYTVHLNMQQNTNHGLHLDMGVFISKIEPNSLAAFEPELEMGDRILSINNKSMEGIQCLEDVASLLNDNRNDSITIFALKNVQDSLGCDPQRRMTTSAAQTDSIDSMHRVTSSKHPSKIAEMLSKFKEKIHISKPGSDSGDHFAQEHDALAALDSVLSENSSEKSKENLFKRNKNKKKEKEAAAKSMGTWPRTSILQATHENPTSTIVQREKKRAPLSLFTAGPINVDKDDDSRVDSDEATPPPLPPTQNKPQSHIRGNCVASAMKHNPNRNSNPIPASLLFPSNSGNGPGIINSNSGNYVQNNYMRHSVYATTPSTMETEATQDQTKLLQRPAPIMGATNMRSKQTDKYGNSRSHAYNYQNRYSLNITPTEFYKTSGQQAQQQVINSGNGINGGGTADVLARRHNLFDVLHNAPPNNSNNNKMNVPHPALFVPLQPQSHQLQHSTNYGRNNMSSIQQQQQQQNSLDMISLKSQNSIDSILSAKSPPISEYTALANYSKKGGLPMPQATSASGTKNVSKYPSDSESIASGITGAGNTLFHVSPNIPPPSRHMPLFPSFTQSTHFHAMRPIRHSSPLTLPSPPPVHSGMGGVTGGIASPSGTSHHHHHHQMDSSIGIPTSSVDKFDVDYMAAPAHSHHHPHQMHAQYLSDYPPGIPTHPSYHPNVNSSVVGSSGNVIYEGGTFPRKKDHQRLRIPSNPSVASKNSGVKNSSGSIDHHYSSVVATAHSTPSSVMNSTVVPYMGSGGVGGVGGGGSSGYGHHHVALANVAANGGNSGRGSPMPQVHVEVLSHGGNKRNANVPSDFLCPGDLRRVTIEKSDKSLGITIQCNNNGGGIFVSTVAEKSIATRAGLQVGDQLLEVCGLNMRSATNDIAANVLRQCGNSITMLVQYNPEKFQSAEYEGTHNLEPESSVNHSGSPTPRNSPRPPMRPVIASLPPMPISTSTPNSSMNPCSILTQPTSLISQKSMKDESFADSLENQSNVSSSQDIPSSSSAAPTSMASTISMPYEEEPRYVTLHMDKSKNPGIKLFGGNKVGIFVHDVHPGSPSDRAGVRKGDQILEYNGVDLRSVTAEQAANEISKLTDTATMLVQNKLQKLKQIKDKSGDSFYIRVGFDRTGDLNEGDLRFVKDEVLYVDNTVFNGTFGLWRAWKLDAKGYRKECGIIPSQMKVEEELRAAEVVECDGSGTARRGSTSTRRSFFRRKKHQRSSSRDSTEIASFSNTQLSYFPDSGILNDDGGILSYQRVERLDSPVRRPVLIIGPLSECVMERLTIDFSNLFKMCEVTTMDCSQEAMEESLQQNIFVDYRRRGNKFECTTVETINNTCKNDRRHCILDISISAVERLQRLQIYPIVLLLRFKSSKQIREIRDFGTEKISAKAAKEMYERALKLESDYKQYISAVIPGVSIKHMCTQIKDAVDKEQDKLLWVPVANA